MVTVMTNANLRAGPGTAYPVIGSVRAGQALPSTGWANGRVAGQPVIWWRTPHGWIAGFLVIPDALAQSVPLVTDIAPPPDMQSPQVTPTALPGTTPQPRLPAARPDLVVLGPETQYPVRAQRIRGDGYEFVDASSQYDLVLQRDVYGAVIRQFWGDRLFGRHPQGIRITLLDPDAPPACAIVCRSCPGQPTIPRLLAPIRLTNDWRGDCHARSLQAR
jgi:hypothetical protein